MEIYQVGGSVRDELLGLTPKDYDYVVVGSTPEEMLSLGYKQVGASFPVFLHPETEDEYALARTEKKNGVGYKGFDCAFGPEVTLEEDLSRRDLTINAIAKDIETREIIDPFRGQADIRDKIIRPTSEHFKDDPLRVLRAARFLAKFGEEWLVSDSLSRMMEQVYCEGELKHLTPERVLKETEKALKEKTPSLYFWLLYDLHIFHELDSLMGILQPLQHHPEEDTFVHTMMALDYAAKMYNDPVINWAVVCHDLGKSKCYNERGTLHGHEEEGVDIVNSLCDRFKVPNEYRELALIATRYHTHSHKAFEMKPKSIMKLFENTKAIQKPVRFSQFLKACKADAKGRGYPKCEEEYHQDLFLEICLDRVMAVDTKVISAKMVAEGKDGKLIGEAIRVARINAIRQEKRKWM